MHRFLFLWIFLLSACTFVTEPIAVTRIPMATAVSATPTPALLTGTEWILTEMNGRSLLTNSQITLAFAGSQAGGFAGCNNYGGSFNAPGDGTFAMGEIARTAQGCLEPEGILEQETVFLQTLAAVNSYRLQGDRLEMTNAAGQTTLAFTRQAHFDMNPADLIGSAWLLQSWGTRELLSDTEITLVFDSATEMRGFAGCRHYQGSYFAEKDAIRFPTLGMVEESCPLTEDFLIQEGDFTTALSQTTRYRWQENQLELFTAPGEVLLFVPLVEESDLTPTGAESLPAELLGQRWQLVAAGDEASDMFLPDPPAWLRFTAEPDSNSNSGLIFEGFSGCNPLFGSYIAADSMLVINVGRAEQDCGLDFTGFENFMVEILLNEPTFTIMPDNQALFLTLQLPDNASGRLVFKALDGS